jgi:hypothetical protein
MKAFRGGLMKRTFLTALAIGALVSGALVVGTSGTSADDYRHQGGRIEVTITNLTRGQILSPAVVAAHSRRLAPIFSAGEAASSELRQVAEDAVNQPLIDLLEASPAVASVGTAMDVIPPGESASVVLTTNKHANFVSLVGMLVTTNDAFFGVNGLRVPDYGSRSVRSPAYDAGTEENNESCAYIPGPPCGNPMQMAEMGEGFVHVHAGIHGIGDLDESVWDWRNPVAMIRVRRVH